MRRPQVRYHTWVRRQGGAVDREPPYELDPGNFDYAVEYRRGASGKRNAFDHSYLHGLEKYGDLSFMIGWVPNSGCYIPYADWKGRPNYRSWFKTLYTAGSGRTTWGFHAFYKQHMYPHEKFLRGDLPISQEDPNVSDAGTLWAWPEQEWEYQIKGQINLSVYDADVTNPVEQCRHDDIKASHWRTEENGLTINNFIVPGIDDTKALGGIACWVTAVYYRGPNCYYLNTNDQYRPPGFLKHYRTPVDINDYDTYVYDEPGYEGKPYLKTSPTFVTKVVLMHSYYKYITAPGALDGFVHKIHIPTNLAWTVGTDPPNGPAVYEAQSLAFVIRGDHDTPFVHHSSL